MAGYDCDISVSLRIAQQSCTQYAPTNQLEVGYGPISVTKTGTFTYGNVIDFTIPTTCSYSPEEVIVKNDVDNGFAVDLVTVNVDGDQYTYDASTYTTWDLDMHLKNDACWYFDKDSVAFRWATPLVFELEDYS